MAQQQIGGLAAIAAYTIDSDYDSEDESDIDKKEDSKQEMVVVKEEKIDIDESFEVKFEENSDKSAPDFGDLYIKEEMVWVEDKDGVIDPVVEFNELQDIKVEIESEDDESSSSDDSDSSDEEEVTKKVVVVQDEEKESTGPIRTKNEITHKDLPPVEDLEIRVAVVDCLKVGVVTSTVEELVVVESIPDMPALDLETVLFTKTDDLGGLTLDLKAVGRVFDVIGPVTRPYYVIRFNSQEHLDSKGVKIGQDIFFAPKSEHTSFVFLEQLMKMKISDASWMNDEEPPPQFLEYSDDEQETRAKQERKIARMVEKGVEPSEVEAKKARIEHGRNKNNERKNQPVDKRHNNGLYSANANPFYRQNRQYDPRDNGSIKWADYNTQTSNPPNYNTSTPNYTTSTHQPNYNTPAPNYLTSTNYPNYYQSSYSVPPPGWPPANTTPTPPTTTPTPPAVQSGGWQSQYNHQSQSSLAGLWQPPPPPPPQ